MPPEHDTMRPHQINAPAERATVERQDEWIDEPDELELPRRPRRRLLGVGGNPIALALLGVLLIACGFIGGVLVEKGESSSGSSSGGAASLASRFAALRAGASGSGGGTRSGSGAATGGLLGGASGSGGGSGPGGGFTRPTAGTVAYLDGGTLYVTNAEGATVKVTTSAGTTVNKTVKSAVKAIHPGETVTVTGEPGSGGAIKAESINVGAGGGGLAALFGGSGARGSGSSGSKGGEPALFGG
jgi:hypothetical protein